MTNEEKLQASFIAGLAIEADRVHDELTYNTVQEWDSTAHMILIAELENNFSVMFDTDDIIDMSSVEKAREILQKYGVPF